MLAPNASYQLEWSLPAVGAPVVNQNFVVEAHGSIAASPASAGNQKVTVSAQSSVSKTLGVPTQIPARVLNKGAVVVESLTVDNVSYQNSGVRFDRMSADGTTALESVLRSNYSVVPLAGAVVSSPTELVQYGNALFTNTTLLDPSANWQSGAAYERFTATLLGDVYFVEDFTGATTGNQPTPVATGTTIAALMSAGGIVSTTDSTTYNLTNGTVTTVDGVTTYVANTARAHLATPEFRTYYELNGNVYVGNLIKSGTVVGDVGYRVANATTITTTFDTQTYQIRLNAAAIASLNAAMKF
ncbi:hypothetical protein GCM10027093_61070 [Paraburkholderia jirisanensis]